MISSKFRKGTRIENFVKFEKIAQIESSENYIVITVHVLKNFQNRKTFNIALNLKKTFKKYTLSCMFQMLLLILRNSELSTPRCGVSKELKVFESPLFKKEMFLLPISQNLYYPKLFYFFPLSFRPIKFLLSSKSQIKETRNARNRRPTLHEPIID